MGIIYREVSVAVEYDYQPEERATRHYPGCAAVAQLTRVTTQSGEDILAKLTANEKEALEEEALASEQRKIERQLDRQMIAREMQAEALRELDQQRGCRL